MPGGQRAQLHGAEAARCRARSASPAGSVAAPCPRGRPAARRARPRAAPAPAAVPAPCRARSPACRKQARPARSGRAARPAARPTRCAAGGRRRHARPVQDPGGPPGPGQQLDGDPALEQGGLRTEHYGPGQPRGTPLPAELVWPPARPPRAAPASRASECDPGRRAAGLRRPARPPRRSLQLGRRQNRATSRASGTNRNSISTSACSITYLRPAASPAPMNNSVAPGRAGCIPSASRPLWASTTSPRLCATKA